MNFPRAILKNNVARVTLFVPDARSGFYRSTRFDWSGMIEQVETGGHSFFEPFRNPHDPLADDAGSGPSEEFSPDSPPGYDEATVGESFLKIGVGHLVRTSDKPYWSRRRYKVAESGIWRTVTDSESEIRFEHDLPVRRGYGYHYSKTIQLQGDNAALVITHELRNTGEKTIDTSMYAHNFVIIDGQTIGSDYTVNFAFQPVFSGREILRSQAYLQGTQLRLKEDLIQNDAQALYAPMSGFEGGGTAANRFVIRSESSGAAVTISGDQPMQSLVVYGQARAICAEPFTSICVKPGESVCWTTTYQFSAGRTDMQLP